MEVKETHDDEVIKRLKLLLGNFSSFGINLDAYSLLIKKSLALK